jgi:hypothetical protein
MLNWLEQQQQQRQQPQQQQAGKMQQQLPLHCVLLNAAQQLHSNCSTYHYKLNTAESHVLDCFVLLQVQHKVTDAITSLDGELCFNIGLAAPLDTNEADKMAW